MFKDEQIVLKNLEKEIILSWKSLENQSDFCINPDNASFT